MNIQDSNNPSKAHGADNGKHMKIDAPPSHGIVLSQEAGRRRQPVFGAEAGHPYYNPFGCVTFTVGGHKLHIGCARGFNAGIIGTEHNGIFMLSVTDKQVVFDRHRPQSSCWHDSPTELAERYREITRILELDDHDFYQFLSSDVSRLRYNPIRLQASKKRSASKKFDKNIRKQFKEANFIEGEYGMTAKKKALLVRQVELFVIARLHFGNELGQARFTDAIYKLLSLDYGHIAHFHRGGFYSAQMAVDSDFLDNLKLMATGKTTWGGVAMAPKDRCADLRKAVMAVCAPYLAAYEKHKKSAAGVA